MRVIILFDLPFIEKEDVLNYNKFIKNIKKVGFYMLQYSVYTKSIVNNSEYQRIKKKILQFIPPKGNIIIMHITEKQYSEMLYLNGEKNKYDTIVGSKNVVMFGGEIDE